MRELLFILSVAIASSFTLTPPCSIKPIGPRACSQHQPEPKIVQQCRSWPLWSNRFERDTLENMTVVELKQELRLQGLKVSGVKAELVDRLLLCASPEGLEDSNVSVSGPQASENERPSEAKSSTTPVAENQSQQPKALGRKAAATSTKSKAKAKGLLGKAKDSKDIDDDSKALAYDLAAQEEAVQIAAKEATATMERDIVEARAGAKTEAKTESEKQKPPAAANVVVALTPEEDAALAARLAKMEDLGERAFEVLKNLGLVVDSTSIDPDSPDYDSSRDDEIADGTIFLD